MYKLENNSRIPSPQINSIIEDFAGATNFGAVVVDIRGHERSKPYNFTTFCHLIRKNPQYRTLCQKCDMYGGLDASKTGKPSIYYCHAGLTDISLPIIKNDQLTGFLQFGQVILESSSHLSYPAIQSKTSNWKVDTDLRQAHDKILIVSAKQIEHAASMLEVINDFHMRNDEPKDRIKFSIKKSNKESIISSNQEITKAINYIKKNLNNPITLNEVADHVFLSQYYFSKLFKKELGVNFVTYLNQQRVDQSKKMLVQTSLSIEIISRNIGFSQTSYFCKTFKKFTNYTPGKYREKYSLKSQ